MTPLAQATAALAAANEQLQQLERHHQELRRAYTEAANAGGEVAALDARLASSNSAMRLAQVKVTEAQNQVLAAERNIEQARGMLVSHQACAADCESRATRLQEQAKDWERQRDQAHIDRALARVALAQLLGVGIDEVDAQVPAPTPPAKPAVLAPSPRLRPTPRLVIDRGVRRYFDDSTGQEVDIGGSPLAG